MLDLITGFLLIVFAYCMGSFATGYHLIWWKMKQDIRNHGSGSIGATNVGRLMGKSGFVITLVGDCLKAVLVLSIARMLKQTDTIISIMIIAVIAGHIWPFYLNFRGGKGIATALGAFLMIDIYVVVFIALVSGLLFLITRRFTLSWILSVILLLIFIIIRDSQSLPITYAIVISSILVVYAHKNNIHKELTLS
ncbi:Acyl-phosphate:glycerol-3-phosphate O-acyltransferase PlsY (EC 2.3.1.n3) [uncultured Gammaproteobacteria bacterium]|jgi:glycerol-3-phosphate acyltransferase PlsY|nr:Acyl-phosphate:glycerol-3-phosphate O-acyltransferase PlsY (EC [Bathymodiolus brooksi thiotrophic gill symbiont]CAC9575859.1 Acyl-phosphate:glycerol-3-phosphate O-acyltransferase PlsY (EC 2.3.1.n3) [uncultured Gammaproteobacteria bacterium]CAB9543040.1 Acyl-phosphate:glycerol-3-phosphate O-acyltransferase PlsY (EC [Bathymodiolus brooksi thiotrophic gill symbiont]CAC9601241.1 Acyl-phosphate:glycerol-3-phosphate O-acyltransferase PlsY (EC 2.3.1.n3) [uncultured Gammaproteobacteria bacterium]CAC